MKEELDEYLEAAQAGDLVEVVDALGDKLYILLGTILAHGCQEIIAPVFEAIQKSNLSKLDAEGNVILREDGKIMKSNLYKPPTKDIEAIILKELDMPVIHEGNFGE